LADDFLRFLPVQTAINALPETNSSGIQSGRLPESPVAGMPG